MKKPDGDAIASAAILEAMAEAEREAFDSLRRYKFEMFAYWAAIWVHMNRLSGERRPNPFRMLVGLARALHDSGRRLAAGAHEGAP